MYNFHTHTKYCDGKSDISELIEVAIKNNFKALGFSSHAPTKLKASWQIKEDNLDKYLLDVEKHKQLYSSKINIYKSFEVDYIQNISGPDKFRNIGLDYIIGSVHYVSSENNSEFITIDHSSEEFEKGVNKAFNGDVRKAISKYYSLIKEFIYSDKPDIIAHIDLIKKFNKNELYFDENSDWYLLELDNLFDAVKQSGVIVELNTRGFYKNLTADFYPCDYFLKKCIKYDVPIILNSDTHHISELTLGFSEAVTKLLKLGCEKLMIFNKTAFQKIAISEYLNY
ncbi:MAG: hypothetical protein A2046_06715 [Bacteroidetes bacterium GWA2_30_7]|nr:MAG: hypothetical protein A2046_06715 [Bacteroidetes bacterium GWA2_30_7]